ncbi:MAG: xanthine dehydrogenase family protein subunit M [Betaproteobacteria bacterium]|nr:xanthine dehydrogenase family protein subunit M [Betaproteobacteria bacterium]
MDYLAPATLDDAYRALEAEDARCLAGGQSLVAMMNLGLVSPARLVSLRRIEALRGIDLQPDGSLRIGAMTTHAEVAALTVSAAGPALLAQTARVVAYPAVRAWGTIGGSVAHADPAADYPVALVAADALIEVSSASGTRRIAARDFFRGLFETALEKAEIVTAVLVPPGAQGAGAAYEKLSPVAGDFAIASVAAIAGRTARLGVGGYATTPIRLEGIGVSDDALLEAGRALAASSEPSDDHRASAAYRRRVLPELIRRAVRTALIGARA